MALSNYHLLPELKQSSCSHKFKDDSKVDTVVTQRLITHDMDFYKEGIEELVVQYDKHLNCGEDFVE
jgi:hypothetical protein